MQIIITMIMLLITKIQGMQFKFAVLFTKVEIKILQTEVSCKNKYILMRLLQ